ncbi:MAG: V-type ATPase subunit [Clostridia bacterium]|nr:V-type ATPase subunit [Clostridia bacterium]
MAANTEYVGGMIAAKENRLLKERIYRMCEVNLSDAFRMLQESSFGAGETVSSVYEYEKLILADEADTDAFIREYSPRKAMSEYLLSQRDFHNAKAIVKARYMGESYETFLAPRGMVEISEIEKAVEEGNFSRLPEDLGLAVTEATEYLLGDDVNGAEIGIIFDKAYFSHILKACRKERLLKKFISVKADMQNVLTAFRYGDIDRAKEAFVPGGKLTETEIETIISPDENGKVRVREDLEKFVQSCRKARAEGKPFSEAENMLSSFEEDSFYEKRYELKSAEPFLYYVFRRRAENENVRVIFVCLLNGFKEDDIKARLRASM